MTPVPLNLLDLRRPAAWCGWAAEALIVALLVFMPLALGVVAPWSEAVVVFAAAAVAVLLAARAALTRGPDGQAGHGWGFSWAYMPIGLFLVLAALQLVPLPAAVVGAVSPHSLAVRRRLLADLPAAVVQFPLSFYPAATRHDLQTVLVCTMLFFAALQLYRTEAQVRRLMWAVALSGGAMAALAMLQDTSGAEKIFWLLDTPRQIANSGPFVGYGNYAQYVNLCTGAALGLLLMHLRADDVAASSRRRSGGSGGWDARGLKNWRTWLLCALLLVNCLTLVLSTSRGGMLAMLCAAGFVALLLARRGGMGNAGWGLLLVLLTAFAALLYIGFDAACDRLATLKSGHDASVAIRAQANKDILTAWRKFPLLGTGLGTHEVVYPMFDRSSDPGLAEYADNDYFQAMEEVGAVGVALVLAFVGFVAVAFFRAVRRGGARVNVAAYGLGFGLVAVLIQSFTDFGQHLPSIGGLSALFCGVLFNLAAQRRRSGEKAAMAAKACDARFYRPHLLLPRLAVPVTLAALMLWACGGAEAARRCRSALDRAAEMANRLDAAGPEGWQPAAPEAATLVQMASAAVAADPSNVKARYQLACYRWRLAAGQGQGEAGPAELPAGAVAAAESVVQGLNDARQICPTFGPVYAVQGQIEQLVLDRPEGAARTRTAATLAPADPQVCFAVGRLDAAEGKWDESVRSFRRAVALDPAFLPQVLDTYLNAFNRPDLAVQVVRDEPERLFELYAQLAQQNAVEERPEIGAALATARGLLLAAGARPDAPAWQLVTLASLLQEQKDYPKAAECYRRALQIEYGNADWHFAFATLLAEAGRNEEAEHEAEICLHFRPQWPAARQLIERVSARPVVLNQR